jgi:hypothetical protein
MTNEIQMMTVIYKALGVDRPGSGRMQVFLVLPNSYREFVMRTVVRFLFVVATFAFASPALAVQTSGEPIKILSCVVASSQAASTGVYVRGVTFTDGVTAIFVNQTSKTITSISFAGSYGGVPETGTITGTFVPGEKNQLTRHYKPRLYNGPDAECHITHVVYEDGTTWGN